MKNILNLTLILFAFSAFTQESKLPYIIKSDIKSDSLKKGECIIYGKVVNEFMLPVSNVLILTIDRKTKTESDSLGNFKLIVSEMDSSIFLYRKGYEQIFIKSYDFKSQHKVEINFFFQYEEVIRVLKPVIYFYNAPQQNISVKLNPKSKLTFTYPKYNDGWNVTATPEGIISDGKRTYPYLFWEGEQHGLTFNKNKNNGIDGFFIKTDSIVPFLEQKLTHMGLNDKEATDFITFWGPRMEQKEYVYIQFFVDESYDKNIAHLLVTPKPNSIKRIYMVYHLTQNNIPIITINEQELPSFNRNGFTVVEWGGSEIKIPFEL